MIYLDYNATTPCDPEVVEAMLPYFSEKFGNASSIQHSYGWQADSAVKLAREQVAGLLHAETGEILFTSGATESCNLALKGVFSKYQTKGKHIITCATEHPAVLSVCRILERQGATLTILPVDANGLIRLHELEAAIRPDTILIAIMFANNETGVIQHIAQIGKLAKKNSVLFFCDATQAIGKVAVDVQSTNIDMMALSGHKIYGPKGVGALYVRRRNPRVALEAMQHGGGQEKELRAGSQNVPGIVGLGKACQLISGKGPEQITIIEEMRDSMEQELSVLPGTKINGKATPRLPNTLNISFEGISAADLSGKLQHQLAFSLGSACASGKPGPSHVLQAMHLNEKQLKGSFRLSLGRFTSRQEAQSAVAMLINAVRGH